MFLRQAFSIPVIQIVYETLKDQQEGKKGKATIKTGASGDFLHIINFLLYKLVILMIDI